MSGAKPIKSVLVANRGEIACRIMRTCREMNIKTIAVYSEADKNALFVRMADEAHLLGPAPSSESYLCIDKLIHIAQKTKADAIHPGYGFLSEKEKFSEACAQNNIIFLGPSASAIAAMGDKITAREWAAKAMVPVVPGTTQPVSNLSEIKKLAKAYQYPILLKAAAGGGGKGMRVVANDSELESAYAQAASEALRAFGDDRLYVEKYIKNPRHVEIQFLSDANGHGYFLFERECSMQRRHQKVIEEAPCVYLKAEVRQAMQQASLALAKAINYRGVGTCEFLVDASQNFYFLEMNTRLQVEHCVTEMITGLDLVRLQIKVGSGLDVSQDLQNLSVRGHAIECRIYAEAPAQNFMPSPGRIVRFDIPAGPGVRVDAGVSAGDEVSVYYDPMMAKIIVHAENRDLAISKMVRALNELRISGVAHNTSFLKSLLLNPEFQAATTHTQYIDQNLAQLIANQQTTPQPLLPVLLGVAAHLQSRESALANDSQPASTWWQAHQSSDH